MSVLPYCEEDLLYYQDCDLKDCVDRECKPCFDPDYDCCYPNDVILLRGPRGAQGPPGGTVPVAIVYAYSTADYTVANAGFPIMSIPPVTTSVGKMISWSISNTGLTPDSGAIGTSNIIITGTFINSEESPTKVTMWMSVNRSGVLQSQSTSTIPGSSGVGQVISNFMYDFATVEDTVTFHAITSSENGNVKGYNAVGPACSGVQSWFTVTIDRVY